MHVLVLPFCFLEVAGVGTGIRAPLVEISRFIRHVALSDWSPDTGRTRTHL